MFFKKRLKSDGTEYDGFLEMFAGEASKTFKKLKENIDNLLINPLKKKLGITDDNKQRFINQLKSSAGKIGGAFLDAKKERIFLTFLTENAIFAI